MNRRLDGEFPLHHCAQVGRDFRNFSCNEKYFQRTATIPEYNKLISSISRLIGLFSNCMQSNKSDAELCKLFQKTF